MTVVWLVNGRRKRKAWRMAEIFVVWWWHMAGLGRRRAVFAWWKSMFLPSPPPHHYLPSFSPPCTLTSLSCSCPVTAWTGSPSSAYPSWCFFVASLPSLLLPPSPSHPHTCFPTTLPSSLPPSPTFSLFSPKSACPHLPTSGACYLWDLRLKASSHNLIIWMYFSRVGMQALSHSLPFYVVARTAHLRATRTARTMPPS